MKLSSYLKNIDSVIAAAIGYYAIYLFTKYNGIGISPDSIMYTSAARSLHDSGALTTFNGHPIVDFPVFYPIFLGLTFFISGIDPVVAGPVINGLLFAGVILISGLLMQHFASKSTIYKWLVLGAIILSPALLQIYTYLWSETLFIFLVFAFFITFSQYLKTHTYITLVVAALVAGISCITRYAGITVIGTGCLLLLIESTFPFKQRWKRIFVFGAISCSLLIANLIRNRIMSGTGTGPREASITGFWQNMIYFGGTIVDWVTIPSEADSVALAVAIITIVGLMIALWFHTFRRNLNHYLVIAITFSLIYGLFIVLSSTFSRYERINDRLLAPMYIPTIWALTWWIIHMPKRWSQAAKIPVYVLFGLCALVIEYRLYKVDYQRWDDQRDYGNPGYADDDWKDSGLVKFMRSNDAFFKSDAPIYSDAPEAVYFLGGHAGIKLLPHRYFPKTVEKFLEQKHYYLILFDNLDNPELINLKYIQQKKNLKKLQQFGDGSIYEYNESDQPAK